MSLPPRLSREARQVYRYFGIWPEPGCDQPWHRDYRIRLLNALRAWQQSGRPAVDFHALSHTLMQAARRHQVLAGADEDRLSLAAIHAAIELSAFHLQDIEVDVAGHMQPYLRMDMQVPAERLSQAERNLVISKLNGDWDGDSQSIFVSAISVPRRVAGRSINLTDKLWLETLAANSAKELISPEVERPGVLARLARWLNTIRFEWRIATL